MNYCFKYVLHTALLTVFTMSANASVVYNYSGNPFTIFVDDGGQDYSNFYNSATSLSISIELANELGTSLTNQNVNPVSYSFSDGVKIITDTSGAAFVNNGFQFTTDSSGNIIGWDVFLQWSLDFGGPTEETFYMRTHTLSFGPEDRTDEDYCVSSDPFFGCDSFSTVSAYVPDNPGSWSVSAVPIPAAVWLFGSGLLGLVGMARRKKA